MTRLTNRHRFLPLLVLGLALSGGLAVGAGVAALPKPDSVDYPASSGGPYPQPLADAAHALAARMAPGGGGYTFEVTQGQNLIARPGGPDIVVQPGPSASPVTVDHIFTGGYMTQGIARPDGFAAQIRFGLQDGDPPDFDKLSPHWGVIERDGLVWRNDGHGWWQIDVAPGTGFDRISSIRLPLLLRRLIGVTDLGVETASGAPLHHFNGQADAVDWPGIIVPDGLVFTASPILVDIWLDAAGQLAQIHGKTINLNEETFQLLCDTTITFGYGDVPQIGPATPLQTAAPSPGSAAPVTTPAPSAPGASSDPGPTPSPLSSPSSGPSASARP